MSGSILATIIASGFTLIGVIITTVCGNRTSTNAIKEQSKLYMYRVEQLEKSVSKHNTIIERTYRLEEHAAILDEKLSVANHRINDLENKNKGA